jgi:prepilin-type N-terminal cleavage/methylation domain-containing protein
MTMKQRYRPHPARCRGFTLIESIMVIVVLGIAAIGIASVQSTIFNGQTSVKNLQVGTKLMEECAEQVLAVRRFTADGYNAVNAAGGFGANQCGGVTALAGYTIPSVTITDPYTGAGCTTGGTCKLVSISQNGMTPITLMLEDY